MGARRVRSDQKTAKLAANGQGAAVCKMSRDKRRCGRSRRAQNGHRAQRHEAARGLRHLRSYGGRTRRGRVAMPAGTNGGGGIAVRRCGQLALAAWARATSAGSAATATARPAGGSRRLRGPKAGARNAGQVLPRHGRHRSPCQEIAENLRRRAAHRSYRFTNCRCRNYSTSLSARQRITVIFDSIERFEQIVVDFH
jgi:hypothetical protein